MNAVYLSGWLNSPIVVVSGESADFHVKTTIKLSHLNAAKQRKYDVFTLSIWRETAKRFMEQARIGSSIMLRGYLSAQISDGTTATEVTVTEFQVASKERTNREVHKPLKEACDMPNEDVDKKANESIEPVLSGE